MRQTKYFNLSLSGILIPLWIVLFFELIKNKTLLTLIITGIISLIILAIFARAIYEVLDSTQIFFKCRLHMIDVFARKTRKKMKELISGTNSPIIMDYAVEKMREAYRPDVCSAILGELAEKERDPGKKENLRSHINRIGGNK
jgi:hypothetical protein